MTSVKVNATPEQKQPPFGKAACPKPPPSAVDGVAAKGRAALPAGKETATMKYRYAAINQGQNLNQFVASAHPDNRRVARQAYKHAQGGVAMGQASTSVYGD